MKISVKKDTLLTGRKLMSKLGLEEKGKVQLFLGKTVADNLKPYVSFKTGVQEASVQPINGGKEIEINVPYASYQAYSTLIKKRNGKRGTKPFERMRDEKRNAILIQVAEYARRISNG